MTNQKTLSILKRTLHTLVAMKENQHAMTEAVSEIGAQTSLQLRSLNIALDIAYRNREVIGHSPVALELINALEQVVLCNYEIVAQITRYATAAQQVIARLEEEEHGGI